MAFLCCFYEVVLLDLGTGVAGPLARFAIERADQAVLVTTPEWVTARRARSALAHVAARPHHGRDQQVAAAILGPAAIEQRFRAQRICTARSPIPYDEQLAAMLDSGTYTLDALAGTTRVAIKQLGLAVAERLV